MDVSYRPANGCRDATGPLGAKGLKHAECRPRVESGGCLGEYTTPRAGVDSAEVQRGGRREALARRSRPSTWRVKTASRWITRPCGGGCWTPAVESRAQAVAVSAATGAQGPSRRAGAVGWELPCVVRARVAGVSEIAVGKNQLSWPREMRRIWRRFPTPQCRRAERSRQSEAIANRRQKRRSQGQNAGIRN